MIAHRLFGALGEGEGWTVVFPIKPPYSGKSRLRVPGIDHDKLAAALAADTLDAIHAASLVRRIEVVTSDLDWGLYLRAGRRRVSIRRDPGLGNLNDAIRVGLRGKGTARTAVIVGDLPALRSSDVDEALISASSLNLAVVADREGDGTTMVTAGRGVAIDPAFGLRSLSKHVSRGHTHLSVTAESTLRWDVDVHGDLDRIPFDALGLRTRRVLSGHGTRHNCLPGRI